MWFAGSGLQGVGSVTTVGRSPSLGVPVIGVVRVVVPALDALDVVGPDQRAHG